MKITITLDDHGFIMTTAEVTFETNEVATADLYNAYVTKILERARERLMMK
jgi:hypothetical protein